MTVVRAQTHLSAHRRRYSVERDRNQGRRGGVSDIFALRERGHRKDSLPLRHWSIDRWRWRLTVGVQPGMDPVFTPQFERMLRTFGAVAAAHIVSRTKVLAPPADSFGVSRAKWKFACHGNVQECVRLPFCARATTNRQTPAR